MLTFLLQSDIVCNILALLMVLTLRLKRKSEVNRET